MVLAEKVLALKLENEFDEVEEITDVPIITVSALMVVADIMPDTLMSFTSNAIFYRYLNPSHVSHAIQNTLEVKAPLAFAFIVNPLAVLDSIDQVLFGSPVMVTA